MPERRSPLASVYRPGRIGIPSGAAAVRIHERVGRTLLQASGWPESFDALCRRLEPLLGCRMPADGRRAVSHGARSIFRVGPERLWLAGPVEEDLSPRMREALAGVDAAVTEMGDSRTVLRVAGVGAATVLNRGLPIDLDADAFPVEAFAQSLIHHMPVLVHRVAGASRAFDAYVTSDYALSFWEWLTHAAESLGCDIAAPE